MDSSAPTKTRQRVILAAIASLVVIAGVAAGVWFFAFSPNTSTVQLNQTENAVIGKPTTLSGAVTPARSARVVSLDFSRTETGPWLPGPDAVTDQSGAFAISHVFTEGGQVWIRATAAELERDQEATSPTMALPVLDQTKISIANPPKLGRTDQTLTLTGSVTPPTGIVTIEKSLDGTKWAKAADPVTVGASGNFTFGVTKLSGDTWQFQAAADKTPQATGGTSPVVTVVIEDYKAAGEKYLQIIEPVNEALVATNEAGYALDGSDAALQELKRAAGKQSKALSTAAKQLRAYPGWPEEVAALIKSFADLAAVEADGFNLSSAAQTIEDFDGILDNIRDDQDRSGDAAVAIRDALDLPKRDPVP